jgi:ribosomal protein S18 acetylase RimI-like enzyme
MSLLIREGGDGDDAACGQIVGRAAGTAVYAARLPHARALFADTSPLARDGRRRLVAELDGRPIGFADYRDDGHVKYLFVDPATQGHGAGVALLDAVQARAGAVSVHVLAVNDVAVAWYLRRGLKVVDGWIEPLAGQDAVWLRLARVGGVT